MLLRVKSTFTLRKELDQHFQNWPFIPETSNLHGGCDTISFQSIFYTEYSGPRLVSRHDVVTPFGHIVRLSQN